MKLYQIWLTYIYKVKIGNDWASKEFLIVAENIEEAIIKGKEALKEYLIDIEILSIMCEDAKLISKVDIQ